MSFVPRSSLVVAIEVRSPSISRPHETARYHSTSKVGIPADRSLPVLPSHGRIPDRDIDALADSGRCFRGCGRDRSRRLGRRCIEVVTCRPGCGGRGDLWLHSAYRPVTMPIEPTRDGGEDD